jgi:small subunit ribosomal protein S17
MKEECNDKHCSVHAGFKTHGRALVGKVTKLNSMKTAQIEIPRISYLKKYERYEKKRTRLHVHYSPCIKIEVGDMVKVMECRPISKTKNFIVIEVVKK